MMPDMARHWFWDQWHGLDTAAVVAPGGFAVDYCSGFAPHGGSVQAVLRSPDGAGGTLEIRCDARHLAPRVPLAVLALSGASVRDALARLDLSGQPTFLAPITDGWRSWVRGFQAGRYWQRSYVISGRGKNPELEHRLEALNRWLTDAVNQGA